MKAVFFDMDGVLVDTAKTWFLTVNKTLEYLGYPKITWKRFVDDFGQGAAADIEFYMQGREKVENIEKLYGKFFAELLGTIKIISGAPSILRWLNNQGVRCVCVTNSNRRLALSVLKKFKLISYFDFVVSGDEGLKQKPASDMALHALQKLNFKVRDVIFIGDSIFDQMAARGAKVRFVSFGKKYLKADIAIDKLFQLKSIVN